MGMVVVVLCIQVVVQEVAFGVNLVTLGAGTVGSGIVTHSGIHDLGGSGGQTPSPNLKDFPPTTCSYLYSRLSSTCLGF